MKLKNELEIVLEKPLQEIIKNWVEENRGYMMCSGDWAKCLAFDIKERIILQLLKIIENDRERKIVDIEDCTILGFSWTELKWVVEFARMKGYESTTFIPKEEE